MNVIIDTNFNFSVSSIQFSSIGELVITLSSGEEPFGSRYHYEASLGSGQAEERTPASLLRYCTVSCATTSKLMGIVQ